MHKNETKVLVEEVLNRYVLEDLPERKKTRAHIYQAGLSDLAVLFDINPTLCECGS